MTETATAETTRLTSSVTPFEYRFRVPYDARAVAVARSSLRAVLTAHELTDLMDPAELLVSELLTNAIVHAGSTAELCLTWEPDTLRLTVWDSSPQIPIRVATQGDGEHGRGLHLLALLSDRWDHFFVRAGPLSAPAKVVWCEVTRKTRQS